MILNIVKLILIFMELAPNSKVVKNEKYRNDIAESIFVNSEIYGIDPYWLTTTIYFESSFRQNIVSKSKLKEYGLCQAHGAARQLCRKNGITIKNNLNGQVECAAFLLSVNKERCGGTIKKAIYGYTSGKCEGTPRAKRLFRIRKHRLKKALLILE